MLISKTSTKQVYMPDNVMPAYMLYVLLPPPCMGLYYRLKHFLTKILSESLLKITSSLLKYWRQPNYL